MTDDTSSATLAKTFEPAQIEARWYAHWESNGLFRPDRPDATPYTIVNPPPNVTGSLHIGHALDNTLQDVVIRYERLRGKDALWVVGTDHAGIATQMVVERQLEAQQDKRTNYTREQFIDKVWEWKAESGGTITGQLRRLGCSMDWSREQFTMDPHFTKAVVKVFVDLYNAKDSSGRSLIYRDKRLVNWDPRLKTAISDLEVETREIKGSFWHFRYPLADGVTLADGRDHLVVATTRPETMLADMAVAVNPADPRYTSVIGKFIELPITGRRIPIVADDHADPELGSGAVKITPGHDFNDFEVGKRAGFKPGEMLNMFDAEANVVQVASDAPIPDRFIGLHRFKDGKDSPDGARERVVAEMKALGHLVLHEVKGKDGEVTLADAEDRTIQTPYGDRGGVVIEPWLTDQWYVNAAELAKAPLEAVRSGAIEIVPKTWEKTFFNWMENIQPWCVSRQLWWGHRIPAWYGTKAIKKDNGTFTITLGAAGDVNEQAWEVFVAESFEEASELAKKHYEPIIGKNNVVPVVGDFLESEYVKGPRAYELESGHWAIKLYQETDVLDTWFSSALWPFATLGWPDDAELVRRHYPNDLLISGFDILFFWNARMAMQGMKFMGDVPWKRLYLHGLVRAADGQKMSKSKGNVVDPLLLIDKFGADALRFFMAAMESQGRDVKMDERRVEGYRNFATKLWNAARFCQSNGISGGIGDHTGPGIAPELAVNKWIIGEAVTTLAELDKAMADLRFDAAANVIYHFVWDTFCDWYIELIKGSFDEETKAVAGWVLDQILVMLHPFMPFVTEELWAALSDPTHPRESELIVARWPEPGAAVDAAAKAEVEWLINLVRGIRATRSELNVPPSAQLALHVVELGPDAGLRVSLRGATLQRLARAKPTDGPFTGAAAYVVSDGATYALPLEGVIDVASEKARLTKALETSTKEAKSLEGRLKNPAFVEKAKPEAVEKARADHAAHAAEAERLASALARLG